MRGLSPQFFTMKAIAGLKKEMTQIFDQQGEAVPCTIIDVSSAKVIGKRTVKKDGYSAVIIGVGEKKNANKAEKGKYKDFEFVPEKIFEARLKEDGDGEAEKQYKVGKEVNITLFKVGDKVNVTGITKGKGFQGVVKRWRFKGGPRTHGQSDRERHPGSIGGGTDPGRVYKGKKMPGHMGNKVKTIRNLEVVKVDKENRLLCVKGAVPGGRNTMLKIVSKQ